MTADKLIDLARDMEWSAYRMTVAAEPGPWGAFRRGHAASSRMWAQNCRDEAASLEMSQAITTDPLLRKCLAYTAAHR